jgi:FlaA1/EpsC-like NDP-sugar epimerase
MKNQKTIYKLINYLEIKFNELGYMPRWVILSIDLFIVLLSCVFTSLLIFSFNSNYYNQINMLKINIIILFVNGIFFILYNTYSGIIRHSTFIDGLKLLISTTSAFAILAVSNYVWKYFNNGTKFFITSGIFIVHALIFIFLFLFRISIKSIFEIFLNLNSGKIKANIVIFGADANAISVANAIKSENPNRFNVVGFIDKNNKVKGAKSILNLPLYNQKKKINKILFKLNADTIILAEKSLTNQETIAIVEECLEYDIKVFAVPTITNWDDYQQITAKMKKFAIEDLLDRSPILLDTKAIESKLNNKNILITGAAGSIGSEIVRQILNFNPEKIIILDQAETALNSLKIEIENLNQSIKVITVLTNIIDKPSVEKIFEEHKPQVVYHAAAYKHVPMMEENPSQAIFTNVLGTKNIADLSEKYNVERFLMISTDKAVNPSSVMGASKRIAEMYIQSKNLYNSKNNTERQTIFITTRFGNVLGSNGSVVPLFTKQIAKGGPITITHPDIIRYFMTIPEACQLVLEACTMGNGGEIFIFDMGKPVKIIDLAKKMIRLAGFTPDVDIKIKTIGLRPGEKLYEELLNDSAKNLPTYHKKITIAEEKCDSFEIINHDVEQLIKVAKLRNNDNVVSLMKKIVPEFKSMNSVFETLNITV